MTPPEPNKTNDSMTDIFTQRTQILQTKLGILSVQVMERLKLRAVNLSSIIEAEEDISNRILRREDYEGDSPALDSLRQQRHFILQDQRSQSVDCWRDLSHTLRDLMSTWEDLEQSKIRDQLLAPAPSSLPASPEQNYNIKPDPHQNSDHYYQ